MLRYNFDRKDCTVLRVHCPDQTKVEAFNQRSLLLLYQLSVTGLIIKSPDLLSPDVLLYVQATEFALYCCFQSAESPHTVLVLRLLGCKCRSDSIRSKFE